ncbi:MAG TPA: response regulator [Rhodoferax sp.]|nr:response regulator [Rhodoferax sp.]HNV58680.1 response regulator [Rhodoferax sp.]HPW08333.1 response regulator [Burkholderiaceae bacterium]
MKRRVLLVDDVALNRKLANALMSRLGWQTLEADGGIAAMELLRSNQPVDLILLDISMPDLSGEEVCKQLRSDPAYAGLKIVAYTAHAGQDDVERFLANGFDAALIKPINSQRLSEVVADLFPSGA